jgi:hypothetical protein
VRHPVLISDVISRCVVETNRTRLIRKTRSIPSFFDFFSPPEPPSEEAIENGDIEEEELEALEAKLEMDYQLGEDIKERVRMTALCSLPVVNNPFYTCRRSFLVPSITSLVKRWNTKWMATTTMTILTQATSRYVMSSTFLTQCRMLT